MMNALGSYSSWLWRGSPIPRTFLCFPFPVLAVQVWVTGAKSCSRLKRHWNLHSCCRQDEDLIRPELNLWQLPWLGVYLLSKTGSHWLKPKSKGRWPPIYCLPFGSQGGLEFNPPTSEKAVGVEETPEKSLEKLGAPEQCGEQSSWELGCICKTKAVNPA